MEHAEEIELRLSKFAWRQSGQGTIFGNHMSLVIIAGIERRCRPIHGVGSPNSLTQRLHSDDTGKHPGADAHVSPEETSKMLTTHVQGCGHRLDVRTGFMRPDDKNGNIVLFCLSTMSPFDVPYEVFCILAAWPPIRLTDRRHCAEGVPVMVLPPMAAPEDPSTEPNLCRCAFVARYFRPERHPSCRFRRR